MHYPFSLILLATLWISACGQPGPLYLPEEPPPTVKVKAGTDENPPIPERDIDQAPPKLTAPLPEKDQPPTESTQ
jgi:predicted small lipoprotein YifL